MPRRQVDTESLEKIHTRRRHLAGIVLDRDMPARDERVGDPDTEHASDVIVARAGGAHLRIDARHRTVARRPIAGERQHGFERLGDARRGEAEIAVAPLLFHREQVRLPQFGEVRRRRLRRHPRGERQFERGQRAPVHQRSEHVRARNVAHEGSDFRDVDAGSCHIVAPSPSM